MIGMQSSMVVMLSRDEVPVFIRTGWFFQNLDSFDEERFEVPAQCYKADPSVTNSVDLMLLLRTAKFWGLDEPPLTAVSYIVRNHGTLDAEYLQAEFPEYATFLDCLFLVGIQLPRFTFFTAIEAGMGLNVVKHLHEQDGFQVDSAALVAASASDNLPCLKWLLFLGFEWNDAVIIKMVQVGSLQCLRHAMVNGVSLYDGAMSHAALSGRLEIVKYLLSLGIKPDSDTVECALHNGNVEMMRVLRQAGCGWPPDALACCILFNHLDCLIYAHGDGLLLTPSLCALAAECGRLNCLEYLHSQGCPWDEDTPRKAVKYHHLECLRFAHQHGCPMSPMLTKLAMDHFPFNIIPYRVWYEAVDGKFITFCIASVCVIILVSGIIRWADKCTSTTCNFTHLGAVILMANFVLAGLTAII